MAHEIGFDKLISKDAGVDDTLALIISTINEYSKDQFVHDVVAKLGPVTDRNAFIRKVFDYYCRNVSYILDKQGVEKVYTPARTICEGKGDCKKSATFLSAVLSAAGIDSVLKHVYYNSSDSYTHIYVIVPNPDLTDYITLDPTNNCQYDKEVRYKSATLYFLNGKKMQLRQMGAAPTFNNGALPFSDEIETGCHNLSDNISGIADSMLGGAQAGYDFMSPSAKAIQLRHNLHPHTAILADIFSINPSIGEVNKRILQKVNRRMTPAEVAEFYGPGYDPGRITREVDAAKAHEKWLLENHVIVLDSDSPDVKSFKTRINMLVSDGYSKEVATKKVIDEEKAYREGLIKTKTEYLLEHNTPKGPGLEEIWGKFKTVSLAIPRGAFLILVNANVHNLAGDLLKLVNNPNSFNELSSTWKSVGGNPDKLKEAIIKGEKKKSIFGMENHTIGVEPVTTGAFATALATATPILILISRLIHKYLPGSAADKNVSGLSAAAVGAAGDPTFDPEHYGNYMDGTGLVVPPPPSPGYTGPEPTYGSFFNIGGIIFKSFMLLSLYQSYLTPTTVSILGTTVICAPLLYLFIKKKISI